MRSLLPGGRALPAPDLIASKRGRAALSSSANPATSSENVSRATSPTTTLLDQTTTAALPRDPVTSPTDQAEAPFMDALEIEGLLELVEVRQDAVPADTFPFDAAVEKPELPPILLAISDNGPQMTSCSTREFMAMCAIAQHFGRPGTPTDQAWIESLFSHVKADWPHLDRIRDPEVLRGELAVVRHEYNTVRLHPGIGYVTPEDEHAGRGPRIRASRRRGLRHARWARITYHRLQQAKANRLSPADVA